jgi:hypothetical protein
MKKGKPRYFMVINDTLMWFEKEQVLTLYTLYSIWLTQCTQTADLSKGAKGSITLAGCSTQMGNNLTGGKNALSLSSESGRTYILTAKSAGSFFICCCSVNIHIVFIVFILCSYCIHCVHIVFILYSYCVHCVHIVFIAFILCSYCIHIVFPYSCCIHIVFIVHILCSHIVYVEEAEEWHSFLRDCIAAANETKHQHANYLTAEGCKSGWLLKKGGGMEQKRWFVLRNRILMWYVTEQVPINQ